MIIKVNQDDTIAVVVQDDGTNVETWYLSVRSILEKFAEKKDEEKKDA